MNAAATKRIFDKPPSSWKELQEQVAKCLQEMGYHVESPKTITLARGKKEIDVYATKNVPPLNLKFFIECKNWESNVPQEVVHSFRTVVADGGANMGIIISRIGFQSGCEEAKLNTNIETMTWREFNEKFFDEWVRSIGESFREVGEESRRFHFHEGCPNDLDDNPPITDRDLLKRWFEIAYLGITINYHGIEKTLEEIGRHGSSQVINYDFDEMKAVGENNPDFLSISSARDYYCSELKKHEHAQELRDKWYKDFDARYR